MFGREKDEPFLSPGRLAPGGGVALHSLGELLNNPRLVQVMLDILDVVLPETAKVIQKGADGSCSTAGHAEV